LATTWKELSDAVEKITEQEIEKPSESISTENDNKE
jgi:hypothetical protein